MGSVLACHVWHLWSFLLTTRVLLQGPRADLISLSSMATSGAKLVATPTLGFSVLKESAGAATSQTIALSKRCLLHLPGTSLCGTRRMAVDQHQDRMQRCRLYSGLQLSDDPSMVFSRLVSTTLLLFRRRSAVVVAEPLIKSIGIKSRSDGDCPFCEVARVS